MLGCAPSTGFRDRLNVELADAHLNGEHLGGFCGRVSENRHSLHIGDADGDEEGGGCTLRSSTEVDDVEAVSPLVVPSSFSCLQCPVSVEIFCA